MILSKTLNLNVTDNVQRAENSISNFWKKNRTLLIYSVIIGLVTYGYEIFNFTLSIDEETMLNSPESNRYFLLVYGRWATYLFYSIFLNGNLLPFVPTLIAVLGIVGSVVLFLDVIEGKLSSKLIFATVAISLPIHSYYLAFNILNAAIGIGFIGMTLSFLCLTKIVKQQNLIIYLIFAVILFAISNGVYQPLIAVFLFQVSAWVFTTYFKNINFELKQVFKILIFTLLISIGGFVLSKIVSVGVNFFYIEKGTSNVNEYFDNYFQWNKSNLINVLFGLIRVFVGTLMGLKFKGGISMAPALFFVFMVLLMIWKKKDHKINRYFGFLILSTLILSPFVFIIVAGGSLPDRTLVAVPFLAGYLWWIISENAKYVYNRIMFFLVMLILVSNTATTTGLFFSCYNSWQADKDMGSRIADRIYTLDFDSSDSLHPVVFIGHKKIPVKSYPYFDDIFGSSFFLWDNGNPHRMINFMAILGVNDLVLADKEQYQKAVEYSKKMPSWPYQGSVIINDGVVIVKLSEP